MLDNIWIIVDFAIAHFAQTIILTLSTNAMCINIHSIEIPFNVALWKQSHVSSKSSFSFRDCSGRFKDKALCESGILHVSVASCTNIANSTISLFSFQRFRPIECARIKWSEIKIYAHERLWTYESDMIFPRFRRFQKHRTLYFILFKLHFSIFERAPEWATSLLLILLVFLGKRSPHRNRVIFSFRFTKNCRILRRMQENGTERPKESLRYAVCISFWHTARSHINASSSFLLDFLHLLFRLLSSRCEIHIVNMCRMENHCRICESILIGSLAFALNYFAGTLFSWYRRQTITSSFEQQFFSTHISVFQQWNDWERACTMHINVFLTFELVHMRCENPGISRQVMAIVTHEVDEWTDFQRRLI